MALVCVSEQDPDPLLVQRGRIRVYSVLECQVGRYLQMIFVQPELL
jgi:hypothetical protein